MNSLVWMHEKNPVIVYLKLEDWVRIIMKSDSTPKWLIYYLALVVLLVSTPGCTGKQSEEELVATKVEITEIIDKTTHMPITNNKINLRWETEDGELIYTEDHVGKKSLTTGLPADGRVRLFITIEAPGYRTWEHAIRLKLNSTKTMYISVEMVREEVEQG